MEEGKGERYLASGRQYGNALLGVRHQEEEVPACLAGVRPGEFTCVGWKVTAISFNFFNFQQNRKSQQQCRTTRFGTLFHTSDLQYYKF